MEQNKHMYGLRDVVLLIGHKKINADVYYRRLKWTENGMPSDEPDGYSLFLDDEKLALLIRRTLDAAAELPLAEHPPLLSLPGAQYDLYLRLNDQLGQSFYYANSYCDDGMVIQRERHPSAAKLADWLDSITQDNGQNGTMYDSRYFEETLWCCKNCGRSNLFIHKACVFCGRDRGW